MFTRGMVAIGTFRAISLNLNGPATNILNLAMNQMLLVVVQMAIQSLNESPTKVTYSHFS